MLDPGPVWHIEISFDLVVTDALAEEIEKTHQRLAPPGTRLAVDNLNGLENLMFVASVGGSVGEALREATRLAEALMAADSYMFGGGPTAICVVALDEPEERAALRAVAA